MVPVDAFYLADLRYVDIELRNILRVGGKPGRVAGNTIVKPGADSNQQVAIFDSIVGKRHAVHTEHMQRQRMFCVTGAERHQGCCYRDAVGAGKVSHRFCCIAVDHAATGVNQWPLGFGKHCIKTLAGVIGQVVLNDRLQTVSIARQRQ